MSHRILTSLLLIFIQSCYGQLVDTAWYDTDNGLPQNSVKDIIKDKHGFIWLSTENGLVRYDGYSFVTYNHLNLKNNRFTTFFGSVEKDSIYNFTAYTENIVLLNKRNINTLRYQTDCVRKALHESKLYGLFVKNGAPEKIDHKDFFIYFGKKNTYHLFNNGIIQYNDRKIVPIKKLHKNYITNTFCLGQNIFIISRTLKKIIKISSGQVRYLDASDIFFQNNVKVYWSQINDQCFLFHDNTLYRVSFQHNEIGLKKMIHYDLNENSLASIYHDEINNKLYLGTLSDGLNVIKFNNFHVANRSDKSYENIFYSILPFEDNKVITPSGDVYNENGLIKQYHFNTTSRYFLLYDSKKNIIVQNGASLLRFFQNSNYSKSESIYFEKTPSHVLNVNNYYVIAFHEQPSLQSQLTFYKDSSFKDPFLQFWVPNIVTSVQKLAHNKWLIGSREALYTIEAPTFTPKKISTEPLHIREITKTKDGNFWIMTQGNGFFLYNKGQLIKMPEDKNGYLLFAHTILEDNKGFLWISTNNGLFKVFKNNLLQYAKDKKTLPNYYRYSKEDGFNTNEFNGGCAPSSSVLQNGYFVFPSIKGLVFFDPQKIRSYYPKNFFLERVIFYDSKSSIKGQNINLENNFYKAIILLDVPYYANRANLVIEAKLKDSKNEKWERINSDGKYYISNLEPGQYQLIARVLISPEGKYLYKTLNINVKYLFYQTLIFKFFIALLLILIVFTLFKIRIKRQEKKKRELEKIIATRTRKLSKTVSKLEHTKEQLRKESIQQKKLLETISHDIITPIKFLSVTAQKLYETDEHDRYIQKKYFESFYKSSVEFYNFVKTLKEYAEIYNNSEKNEIYNIYELVEVKKALFEGAAKEQNVVIINNIKDPTYSKINQNVLAVIIHNLIDNAVKNTTSGIIELSMFEYSRTFFLEVKDTGKGMSKEQMIYYEKLQDNIENEKLVLQKYSLGLHLILQLLMMINGKIEFKNNIPQGTIISIKIKKQKHE
ncbi:two-component regulator propeller domain-containing protein [Chryseobacterium sp. ES2]|uniref:Two-component regulator propeller domain-containing protein n=1 Tax=Chryseobacterium metallicongregator TaxID=3073042 RepID=A0ABU1DZK0_9FLAO|nr:two-component regulator propeller domain-containing protein [Chryseobacterium sp. ES2]MDR4950967.1 two-component regulator propeller domain-containing protein [Chryseobacterium sp. ES2]